MYRVRRGSQCCAHPVWHARNQSRTDSSSVLVHADKSFRPLPGKSMFASCIGSSQHEQDGRRQGQSRWGNEPLIGDGFRDIGVALIIGVAFHTKATGYMPQTSGGTNGNAQRPSRSGIAPRPARGNRLAAGHSPLDKQARRIPALLAVLQIFFQTHCQAWQTYSLARGWDERWPGEPYAVSIGVSFITAK